MNTKQTQLITEFYRKIRYDEPFRVVCMGDSLTYGYDIVSANRRSADSIPTPNGSVHIRERASITYPEALKKYLDVVYPGKSTIINRGFSGDTVLTSFPKWITNPNSDVTLIMLGTNDSSQEIGVDNYLIGYRQIIERELEWGSAVILLTPPRRLSSDIKGDTYGNAAFQLSNEYGCPVVDMTELTANMSADNFSDTTHFNGKGYNYLGARLASIFIGEGLVNPNKVSSGDTLLCRKHVDGVEFINGVIVANDDNYPTADEQLLGYGNIASMVSTGGKLIYTFYAETDNLLVYPSIYFGALNTDKVKMTLDFGTESQALSSTYILDQMLGDYEKHVPTIVEISKSECNWGTPKDSYYIQGVKDLAEKKIHIPKKGWHTIMIESNDVRLHSMDFISYREMRSMIETNKLKYPNWIDCVYENGWVTSSGPNLKYCRQGNIVILVGWITKPTIDTTIIATIPVGFRPITTQKHKITVGNTLAVQTAEPTLSISNSSGAVSLANVGIITNNILAINVMFAVS